MTNNRRDTNSRLCLKLANRVVPVVTLGKVISTKVVNLRHPQGRGPCRDTFFDPSYGGYPPTAKRKRVARGVV